MRRPTIYVNGTLLWLDRREYMDPANDITMVLHGATEQCEDCGEDIMESCTLDKWRTCDDDDVVKCKCGCTYPVKWRNEGY